MKRNWRDYITDDQGKQIALEAKRRMDNCSDFREKGGAAILAYNKAVKNLQRQHDKLVEYFPQPQPVDPELMELLGLPVEEGELDPVDLGHGPDTIILDPVPHVHDSDETGLDPVTQ